MPTLLTFGDSNTHGTLPIEVEGERNRLRRDQRWPGICQQNLGVNWTLVEEGLPGRTTRWPDPEMGPHMDGRVGLFIALESHGPIDFMTLMLGTNDLKTKFDVGPEQISQDVRTLLDIALSDEMQERHNDFKVLLICPPPILEQGVIAEQFIGGRKKSLELSKAYADIAKARGVAFLDAGTVIESSPVDGIHFGAEMHAKLGHAVAGALRGI
ncbi:MAG: SGNH/GDSL hydrolase family protein [Paracoccaceae bacterium]